MSHATFIESRFSPGFRLKATYRTQSRRKEGGRRRKEKEEEKRKEEGERTRKKVMSNVK